MKPRNVLLHPLQRKLLFESAQPPIQCWLEPLACGTGLERFSEEQWEEILLMQGDLDCNRSVCRDIYLCLTPGQSAPPFCAGNAGAVLLRMFFAGASENDSSHCAVAHGKPPMEIVDLGSLAWDEIPARRANDPGARIVELSTNATRTRITSLMD